MFILHVGAGKCGSSALQHHFSNNPVVDTNMGVLAYHVLSSNGILSGSKLTEKASKDPRGYVSSQNFKRIHRYNFKDQLSQLLKNDINLFSAEGWINEGGKQEAVDLISQFPEPVHIVMFVRPQVPVMNSSYWQWGAWADEEFEHWVNERIKAVQWYNKYSQFLSIDNVSEVKVKILGTDIVDDFKSAFSLHYDRVDNESPLYNKSLNIDVLRLMQKYRNLRKDPHDSSVDFIISKFFGDLLVGGAPWVLDEGLIRRIQDKCRKGNKLLLDVVSDSDKEKMLSDERWWQFFDVKSPLVDPLPQENLEFSYEKLFVRALEVLANK